MVIAWKGCRERGDEGETEKLMTKTTAVTRRSCEGRDKGDTVMLTEAAIMRLKRRENEVSAAYIY